MHVSDCLCRPALGRIASQVRHRTCRAGRVNREVAVTHDSEGVAQDLALKYLKAHGWGVVLEEVLLWVGTLS
jgi:hypothetical protein